MGDHVVGIKELVKALGNVVLAFREKSGAGGRVEIWFPRTESPVTLAKMPKKVCASAVGRLIPVWITVVLFLEST